jgi:hypothetical protein
MSVILISGQTKINEFNLETLTNVLKNGDGTLFLDTNNTLLFACKENELVVIKNAIGDYIKEVFVEDIPTALLPPNSVYSLIANKSGDNYKIHWGLVSTEDNYNVVTGDTTFTITALNPKYQIFNAETPGEYFFNGSINITTTGAGATASKRYSIDNGLNYTDYSDSENFTINNLGGLMTTDYELSVQDITEQVIYSDTVSLSGPTYEWDFIGEIPFIPLSLNHILYKEDDPTPSNPTVGINIVVDDGEFYNTGLYDYNLYLDGRLVFSINNYPLKNITIPINFDEQRWTDGNITATVDRTNGGSIKFGMLTDDLISYEANKFSWSTNNGNNFIYPTPSSNSLKLNTDNTVEVIYNANTFSGQKKIFMLRTNTDEVYQYNHNITGSTSTSTQDFDFLKIKEGYGIKMDNEFSTFFSSDDYYNPTVINRNHFSWVANESNPLEIIDNTFVVSFLSTQFSPNPGVTRTMSIFFETIDGLPIYNQVGVFLRWRPGFPMRFEFYIEDFESIISDYFDKIIRVKLIFNLNDNIDPNDNISSNLKFIKYASI